MSKQDLLVCEKCGGTKWTEGTHLIYTVMPAIHSQEYICSKCGNKQTVETRERVVLNLPKEVRIDPDYEVKHSKVESDTSILTSTSTTTGISTDTTFTFTGTTKK